MSRRIVYGLLFGCVAFVGLRSGVLAQTPNDLYLLSTPRIVSDGGCQQIVEDIASLCGYDKSEEWNNSRSILWSSKDKGMAIANCMVSANNDDYSVAFAAAYSGQAGVDTRCLAGEFRKRVNSVSLQ